MKKIIKIFNPLSGKHCNTSSIQQIFHYFGHKLSEEMIFGLTSGLHFVYFEFKFSPTPFIGRLSSSCCWECESNNSGLECACV